MNPRTGRISSLGPLRTFRESATNKVSISDDLLNFVPCCLNMFSFFLKCYPSFCVNFLHSTIVFHHTLIRVNLSGVNFQYLIFMESYVNFLLYWAEDYCPIIIELPIISRAEVVSRTFGPNEKKKKMNFGYLPLAVFIALMPVGPSKFLNQMSGIQHNRAKDPNWPEANQVAIHTEAWSRI